MRQILLSLSALALVACGGEGVITDNESTPVDPELRLTVFTGGTIYTGVGMQTAEAVVVDRTGRITAIAPNASDRWEEDELNIINLDGAVMFPGFTDGHAHLIGIGERELTLDLAGTASLTELVTRVEAEVYGTPSGRVLFGRGWIETGWDEGRMPNAADLDAVAPDNPVILVRADGHALVANTAALNAAGITDETADVTGGKIERDADGKATGIIIDKSMAQVLALVSEPTDEQIAERYVVGAAEYVSRGWTGIHNMSVPPVDAALLERLDLEGQMPLRLHNGFDQAGFSIAAERQYETPTITNRAVKVYMDGALGSRGALLIEPYSDRPGTSGLALMEPEALAKLMGDAEDSDVQLAIHAIGDLANRRILDEFSKQKELSKMLIPSNGEQRDYSDNRWRIEHTQVLHPDDIARVGELGLIASMQPSHAIGDLKFAPARLGIDRLAGAYAWQSLLDNDAIIVGGSDAPVEVGTPQIEFYAAVARKDLEGFSGEGWHPEEALTREQALALFTTAPAYAAFMENDLGTIEVGKIADFSVFDRDLMTVSEADILKAETVMTIVHGEVVYQRKAE